MENRHGLAVGARVTLATGTAEREAAVAMAGRLRPGVTLGADKGYDARAFIAELRAEGVTPHIVQNTSHRTSRGGDPRAGAGSHGRHECAGFVRGRLPTPPKPRRKRGSLSVESSWGSSAGATPRAWI
jgi:hypothetical protein